MASGVSTTLANSWLDALCNATSYSETTVYAQLHTGAPGSAGTTAASAETDRQSLSFAAASSGAIDLDTTASWDQGDEDLTHISVWDAASSGNFLFSADLSSTASVSNGDTFNLTSLTVTFTTAS